MATVAELEARINALTETVEALQAANPGKLVRPSVGQPVSYFYRGRIRAAVVVAARDADHYALQVVTDEQPGRDVPAFTLVDNVLYSDFDF